MVTLRSLLLAMGLLIASGCGSEAVTAADARAERAGVVMGREREGTAADMARRVVGGTPEAGAAIEVLVAEGDRFDGRIVLRITERTEGGFLTDPQETVRCYEYRLRNSIDDSKPDQIDCPDLKSLSFPPPTAGPTLPAGIEESLRNALESLDPDEVTESAALEAARDVSGDAALLEVATRDGIIGIAIGNGQDECVTASVAPDAVDVWRVPPVVAQPGELGCSAEAAARGEGKIPPS